MDRSDPHEVGGETTDARNLEQVVSVFPCERESAGGVPCDEREIELAARFAAFAPRPAVCVGWRRRHRRRLPRTRTSSGTGDCSLRWVTFSASISISRGISCREISAMAWICAGTGSRRRVVAGDRRPHRQHIGEETDQSANFGLRAVGDGRTRNDVRGAAVTGDKNAISRLRRREQRTATTPREILQRPAGCFVQFESMTIAPEFRRCWPRFIGRKLMDFRRVGQSTRPVGQLRLKMRALQPVRLPCGVIAEPDGQRIHGRVQPGATGIVNTVQLIDQDIERPAICGDVMDCDEQLRPRSPR